MTSPRPSDQQYQSAVDSHRNGQLTAAEKGYRQLLEDTPQHADALHLLGVLCHQTGRSQEAVRLIAQAISLNPKMAEYLNHFGLVLRSLSQFAAAASSYERALALTPNDADLLVNLGYCQLELKRYAEAADCYRRVLQRTPQDANSRAALAHSLQTLANQQQVAGQYAEAETALLEAIDLQANNGALHYNLGNAQRELGKTGLATASYRHALTLLPQDADIYNNLGNVLRECGKLDEAIACYQTALRLNPALHHARVHLVHQKQHICDWQDLAADSQIIRDWVRSEPKAQISPFAFIAMPDTTATEQLQCANHWLANRFQGFWNKHFPGKGLQDNDTTTLTATIRLRIGYLSADFRQHPLASLVTDLIAQHDRSRFEVFGYSYGADDGSPERERLITAFNQLAFDQLALGPDSASHFVDIRPLSLAACAERIREDAIDILVDLTGFTQTSRSGIVALKPAPISVNWLGFPGSMGAYQGVPLFDYLLSDACTTPPENSSAYAEKLVLLPDSYQPNNRQRMIAASVADYPGRQQCGLPERAFVYCCFNQTFKITPTVFALWMRLLAATPDSVLWLLACNRWAQANLCREAELHGIQASRLIFAPRVAMKEHLARHVQADLFLDTQPYNAHTTASDALWMGLPVLTCLGQTFAGRVAASLLKAVNLPQLITHSLGEYEARAKQLAADPGELSAIRAKLRTQRDTCPLFDTERFARGLECAYTTMWQRHVSGQAPESFSI